MDYLVMLQKYILGSGVLTNWQNVDLCMDNSINFFDMVLLQHFIIKR